MKRLIFVVALLCGCGRAPVPAAEVERSLFGLSTEQLFERGITEVTQGVDQASWMLATIGPGDDGRSQSALASLFAEHGIQWFGSAGHGFMAVYVAKTNFPRAQVLLSQCKKKNRLKLLVWETGQTMKEVEEWTASQYP